MLSFLGSGGRLCDRLSRREWLRVGGLGVGGLSLPQLLASRAARANTSVPAGGQASGFGRARSCIILNLVGGPPQHETWDPKPDAPTEIRGAYKPIASATPGLHVGELMPRTARLTDRIAVLRAMATDDNAHSSSGYYMLTGQPHAPKNRENANPGSPNDFPSLAAVVRHLRGDRSSLPGAVRLPEHIWNTDKSVWPGQDAGWLGDHADPWLVLCDPSRPDFRPPDISLPVEVTPERLSQRLHLQTLMNRKFRALDDDRIDRWSTWQTKAIDLMQSEEARRAFAIDREPDHVRDRYGRHRFGQSVLLARRLVEAGVSLVQVNWNRAENDPDVKASPMWDTHKNHAGLLKSHLMTPMDMAYSALLEDLATRGLLEETLVVWMGEFGRTPKINAAGGRDHWGNVFSVALAGGGVRGGAVYGASDRQGGYPVDGRVEPQDLIATIHHCLGHAATTELHDRFGRPLVITRGKPIEAIL
jgi:hypothetical protein